MPLEPEVMELWARRFEIQGTSHVLQWALAFSGSLSGSRAFFLEGARMILLQLPAFPNRQYFGWEEIPGAALSLAGLADGGRVILLWMFYRG